MHWLPSGAFTQTDLNRVFASDALKGGSHTPKSKSKYPKRIFYYVDDTGKRVDGHPAYGVSLKPGSKNPGPIDIARKIVHRVLRDEGAKASTNGKRKKRVPKSVQNAVKRAIKQNFMCDCGAACRSDCHEQSKEKGQEYLDAYFDDPAHLFTDGVTVGICERGKKSIRRYNGCYRRLSNPNNHSIRVGLRKEPVVSYVDTLRIRG